VTPSRIDRAAAWVLLVAVGAAWVDSFGGRFQHEDFDAVLNAPQATSLAAWLAAQPSPFPLLSLSYALNHVCGAGLAGYHAVNLLIHAINAVLVYAVLRRLTHREDIVFRDQRLAAFLAAAVFALHPAQVEAVTYVSGRSMSLGTLFALLSILLWLRGREYEDLRDLHLRSPLAMAVGLLAAGFVAVVPLALLLVARLQAARGPWQRYALRESAVHWLLAVAAVGIGAYTSRESLPALANVDAQDLLAAEAAQAQSLAAVAANLVRIDRLNADPAPATALAPDAANLAVAGAVGLLFVFGLLAVPRRPVLAFSVLWFFAWFVPAAAETGTVHDRHLHVAMIGPALGVARVLLRLTPRFVQWALVAVLLAGLGTATFQRNVVYADEIAYWRDAADKAPHNARALARLGHALALACREADATRALQAALEHEPQHAQAAADLEALRAGTLVRGCKSQAPPG
jgi:hypothetical protein